jgi:carboxylesterase
VRDDAFRVDEVVRGDGDLGCLLLHGLTGTPAEMAPLVAPLAGRPLWLARIAGHDGRIGELARCSWRDWYASAERGADALLRETPRIVAIGLSMGALLALRLARLRPEQVAGVVLLSPAAGMARPLLRAFRRPLTMLGALDARSPRLQSALARVLLTKGLSDIADDEVRATHPGYRQAPLRALMNLFALQRLVLAELPRVTQPALVMHARLDHTAPLDAAELMFAALGASRKRMVVLEDSFHVVTVDRERAVVGAEVRRFVDEIAATGAPERRQP